MCGVFGFIADGDQGPNMQRLSAMATATERRGQHAFGMAWIDAAGRLRMFKQAGRISDHLGILNMAADARVLVGHCRYSTSGPASRNDNNHPHPADSGWYVHNGVVDNYAELVDEHELHPMTDCDSEALGLMLERSTTASLLDRCAEVSLAVRATAGLAMVGLWKPGRLVIVKRGKPLSMGTAATGTYFGSTTGGLPKDAAPLRDWTARLMTWQRDGEPKVRVVELEPREGEEGESGRMRARLAAPKPKRGIQFARTSDAEFRRVDKPSESLTDWLKQNTNMELE